MTVQDVTLPIEKPGNGAATIFSFSPLRVFAETDLKVSHKAVDGTLTEIPLGTGATDFAVQADFPGDRSASGSVVYPADQVTPMPAGESIFIGPDLTFTQDLALENQGGYLPALQEGGFDRAIILLTQLREEVDRALKMQFGITGVDTEVPAPDPGKGLFWNDTGTALENRAVSPLAVLQTQNMLYDSSLIVGTPTHLTDLQKVIDHLWSTGVVDGGDLTDNGDGTIDIDAGECMMRSAPTGHGSLYLVKFDAQAGIALTDDATNYVYLDWNAGAPQFAVTTTEGDVNQYTKVISYIIHRNGNILKFIDMRNFNVDAIHSTNHFIRDTARFHHKEGGTAISEPSNLDLGVTAGEFYHHTIEIEHPTYDTSVGGTANENIFDLWFRDGVGGWTETIEQKTIDSTIYDDNSGTPAALSNNKFGVSWIYIINDTPSELHVVMGQGDFADQATAEASSPPASLPSIIEGLGVLIGVVVYQKSVTNFNNILSAFAVSFAASAAVNHNALAGLQGGTIGEFYHMTSAQNTELAVILDGTGADTVITDADKIPFYDVSDSDNVKTDTLAGLFDVHKGVANEYTKTQNFNATTLTDQASIAWDASSNQVASVTLAGNRTLAAATNQVDGGTYVLTVKQDATGSRTLAYDSTYKFPGGVAPTLSTAANAVDILTFVSDGTNMYGVSQSEFS